MTISTTANRALYNGNGATVNFSFPYLFFQNGDLKVYVVDANGVETLKTITTHYTVTGAGSESGGTVTMLTPPSGTEKLLILRQVSLTQETDYISGESFPAETHERALDRLTMMNQQLQEQVDRTLTIPPSSSASTQLPSPEAAKLLGWSGDASEIVNYTPPIGGIAVPLTSSTGSAVIPSGGTGLRDSIPVDGYFRFNSDTRQFEGYKNGQWGNVGGGATGAGSDACYVENDTEATQPYEIGQNELRSGVTITIASPAVLTLAGHGYVNGQQVRLKTTGALPTGLSQTAYFVVNKTTDTFQLSATRGGAAINTSGTQSGTHSVGKCKNVQVAGPFTFLDGADCVIPDGCGWTING